MDVQQKIKLNSSKVRAKESDRPKLIEDFRDSLQVCRELELGLMPATFRSTQCNAASCGVLLLLLLLLAHLKITCSSPKHARNERSEERGEKWAIYVPP